MTMDVARFKKDEIVLLLGAGASVEANIPDSRKMIARIEELVERDSSWSGFVDLYRIIKSAFYFAEGQRGNFEANVSFNVERLVDILQELEMREEHALAPFVGAWHRGLTLSAGEGSKRIIDFRLKIINELRRKWVELSEVESAEYFKGLLRFQEQFQYPLRVFSLNYDLCVEKACGYDQVERGFEGRNWDWRSFEETSDTPPPLMLYKLHGSLDWKTEEDGTVRYVDAPSTIESDDVAIIFGTAYKRQYVDPFLFLAYEFRRWTLDAAKVIVCIGYSFGDGHINDILRQSLKQNTARRVVAVFEPMENAEVKDRQLSVSKALGVESERIRVLAMGARGYLESALTIESLANVIPADDGDDIRIL